MVDCVKVHLQCNGCTSVFLFDADKVGEVQAGKIGLRCPKCNGVTFTMMPSDPASMLHEATKQTLHRSISGGLARPVTATPSQRIQIRCDRCTTVFSIDREKWPRCRCPQCRDPHYSFSLVEGGSIDDESVRDFFEKEPIHPPMAVIRFATNRVVVPGFLGAISAALLWLAGSVAYEYFFGDLHAPHIGQNLQVKSGAFLLFSVALPGMFGLLSGVGAICGVSGAFDFFGAIAGFIRDCWDDVTWKFSRTVNRWRGR